jgi:hypothetical protein
MGRSKHLAIAVAISVLDSIVGLLDGVRYGGHGRVISGSADFVPVFLVAMSLADI